MPPVKKQKVNKKKTSYSNSKKKEKNLDGSVVSGQLQKKINKKPQKSPKGVVFIKHLPHGFFEEQLKNYFEQFGEVTRVRLARSQRTGNSKGYAFVEFDYPEVAEVAAETMDNYLMFKKIIKATYIPPEKQQFNYFRTSVKKIRNKSGKLVWVSRKTASILQKAKKYNDWSGENYQKRTQRQMIKIEKIGEKCAKLGIDINKLIVQPNILTGKEKKQPEIFKAKEEKSDVSSKAIKRKTSIENFPSNKKTIKKSKDKVSLEDLLGNTLQEDSEDEDYIAKTDSEESEQSSDEEMYGFAKDSDNEYEQQDGSKNAIEVKAPQILKKRDLKNLVKASNVERFDQMLNRKPHTGGINKLNKRSLKQPSANAKTAALQITAAKELAKPLSKLKRKKSMPRKDK